MESTGIPAAAEERNRAEAVVEALAVMHRPGESLGELAHDARNMMTALSLYCDLLEEPGVLAPTYRHYGSELRLLSEASRHLVEKLMALDCSAANRTTSIPSSRQVRTLCESQGY